MKVANALTIYSVTQSSDDGYGSAADNMLDGNNDTLWMAKPDKAGNLPYAVFDLGESKTLDTMNVLFYMGKSRLFTFSVYVSEDNVNFTPVLNSATNAKKTDGFEVVGLNGAKGRYVKLEVEKNSYSRWTLIGEIAFTGK